MSWNNDFYEAMFPIDERVLSVPYALKKPSNRGKYLDRIIPDRKRTNLDLAFKLLEKNMPSKVYKYRKVTNYSLQNFMDDTIWMSNPKDFNDPFDSVTTEPEYKVNVVVDRLKENVKNDEAIKKIEGVFTSELIEELESMFDRGLVHRLQFSFLVACLSETNESVLMWSHYADDHKGFCVEYSGNEIYKNEIVNKRFFPVKYVTKEEYSIPVSAMALEYSGLYSVLCKTEDWAYEKEWRICFGIEELGVPHNLQLPKATGVYIGVKMPDDDRKRVIDIAHRKNIPIYLEKLNNVERKIYFEPLKD